MNKTIEAVQREEGDWHAARIHFLAHSSWSTDDCEKCRRDEVERSGGATIRLTPWAAQALSLEDQDRLAMRAVDLHCRIGVLGSSPGGPWGITVSSWERDRSTPTGAKHAVSLDRLHGNLAAAMDRMLDRYEASMAGFTAEELVQIAAQSGIEVNRA